MLLLKKVAALQKYLQAQIDYGQSIGFVPTMGALHQGHLSLIKNSKRETDISVCSIFVNPTQFNDSSDLDKYPRTISADIEKLESSECDVLFFPSVDEVYPNEPEPINLDFGYLDQPMEGANRPGHFAGMAQVVKRLLDIVKPHKLFMGQKDYQQAAIVRNMLSQLEMDVKLVVCPIVRENDGLAMSSRNVRLSKTQREMAPLISKTLIYAKSVIETAPIGEIEKEAMKRLTITGMKSEYFEIVDGITLEPVSDVSNSNLIVACTAVNLGDIRLIDNMILLNKN